MDESDLIAALNESSQWMSNRRSIGRWTLAELDEALVGLDVLEGPFTRDLPDGRRQFYAFYRHEDQMKPYPPGSSLPRRVWLTFMARVDAILYWIDTRGKG